MSNIKTNKKIILITLGILLVLSLLVGASYAYYIVTHSQTNSNVVKSTCISLSLTNEPVSYTHLTLPTTPYV